MEGWSDETMRPAGGGMRTMKLDAHSAALVRVAAALAEGRIAVLRERLDAARAAGVPDLWVDELLLQSFWIVGCPLALVAFGVWREVTGALAERREASGEALAHEDWESWAERGRQVCAGGYGRAYHKLPLNLRAPDPALEDHALVDAYGEGIGRAGVVPQCREDLS